MGAALEAGPGRGEGVRPPACDERPAQRARVVAKMHVSFFEGSAHDAAVVVWRRIAVVKVLMTPRTLLSNTEY